MALIHSGDLEAQKFGRSWAVSEESVRSRLATAPYQVAPLWAKEAQSHPGLHAHEQKRCRLALRVDSESKRVVKVEEDEYVIASPIGSCRGIGKPTATQLTSWITDRYIPENRIGLVRYSPKQAAKILLSSSFKRSDKTSPINIGSSRKVKSRLE